MIFDGFFGRNLQQQVMYLTWLLGQGTDVVKSIVGHVDAAGSLPAASLYPNGTTFAVGSDAPYTYYVAQDGNWLNIGVFPLAGADGAQGADGRSIYVSSYEPDPASVGQSYIIPLSGINGTPAVNDLVMLAGRYLSIITAVSDTGATALLYSDLKGEAGAGQVEIESMETPYQIDSAVYTPGVGIVVAGHGRINGGEVYNQTVTIPITVGANMTVTSYPDGKGIVIASTAKADKWTDEAVGYLQTVLANLAYTSESAGQDAADSLIALLTNAAQLTGITATATSKVRYVGDSLTASDFAVYGLYDDGTSAVISDGYTVDPSVITETSIVATIAYKGYTASVAMTAVDVAASAIDVVSYTPSKTLYIGDTIATSGYYTYIVTYNNGTKQTMTSWAPISVNPATITGESTDTTVSYGGTITDTYTITGAIAAPVATTLTATYTGSTDAGTEVTADNWSWTVQDQYGADMTITGAVLVQTPSSKTLVVGANTVTLQLNWSGGVLYEQGTITGVEVPVPTTLTVTYTGSTDAGTVVTVSNWTYAVKDQYGADIAVSGGALSQSPTQVTLVEGANSFALTLTYTGGSLTADASVTGQGGSTPVTSAIVYIYPSDYNASTYGAMQEPYIQTDRASGTGWNIIGSGSPASSVGTHGQTGNWTFPAPLTITPKTLKITRISTEDIPNTASAAYDGVYTLSADAATATGTGKILTAGNTISLTVTAGDIAWIMDGTNYAGISLFCTDSSRTIYFGRICPHGVRVEVSG